MHKAFFNFRVLHIAVILALLLSVLPATTPTQAAGSGSPNIVISQLYGGGGATTGTPTFKYDYVELFNRSAAAQALTGWSIQYGSATGNFSSTYAFPAGTSIGPGKYLLVQVSNAGTVGAELSPAADQVTSALNLAAANGKVVLANVSTALGCGATATLCNLSTDTRIVDLVAYGTGNNAEGGASTGALSTTSGAVRNNSGCTDTDSNNLNFAVVTGPVPRNSSTAQHLCTDPTPPSGLGTAMPNLLIPGESPLLMVTVLDGSNPTSTTLSVQANLSTIGGEAAQVFSDDGSNGDVTADDKIFSFAFNLPANTAAGSYSLPFTVSDGEGRSSSGTIALKVTDQSLVAINAIQGSGHASPLEGQSVFTQGIVTAKRPTGFYIQTPVTPGDGYGDGSDATSEGLFVFTSIYGGSVSVGDLVRIIGPIAEYRSASANHDLKVTELSGPTAFGVYSHENALPDPVLIGEGGRVPPNQIFYGSTTDPVNNGIDFYEAMEGMRVEIHDAVATGPTAVYSDNSDLPVVIDNGMNSSPFTPSGGLYASASDYNPERILLNDLTSSTRLPVVNVGAKLGPQTILGVMDYSFSNYKLEVTSTVTEQTASSITKTVVTAPDVDQLSVATFNVENLAATNAASKFANLASVVINNLKSPDVLAIEEIQDNNGATDTAIVAADQTWGKLITAITTAGGPTYTYQQIDPANDSDGGQTGGNIRQGFLYRTDRGLNFVTSTSGSGDATTANTIYSDVDTGAHLTYNPGRIDPTNTAFTSSRKPLAGEFMFRRHKLFIIANHFNSKGGDTPLFGDTQPPVLGSEAQRIQQATVVSNFVKTILDAEPAANVVVLGDLNDFPYSPPITTLKGSVSAGNHLNLLMDDLPADQQYTYNFGGNAQAIDHTLVSDHLKTYAYTYTPVHINADFADKVSDHDPQVTVFSLNDAPVVNANPDGAYSVAEGGTIQLSATATDPEGDAFTLAWDLDNDGVFETDGSTATFIAGMQDGGTNKTFTVHVKATDQFGVSSTVDTVVAITNTAPTGYLSGNNPVQKDEEVTISFVGADDPSAADKANLHFAFDCEGGDLADATYANSSTNNGKTCSFSETGTHIVSGVVIDPDGGRYLAHMDVDVEAQTPPTYYYYLPVIFK